jgi:hypothetical protein
MAQPSTDTFETYDSRPGGSIREELCDVVEDISPTETPFMSMIGREKAKSTFHEWQLDILATPADDNAHYEGDDATIEAITPPTRVGNYTQISKKVIMLTGTQQVVDHAGIPDMKGYQLHRRALELKTDMDKQMCSNKASVVGTADGAAARQSGGYECFITTNDALNERGTGGAGGGYAGGLWTAPTDGTQRAIAEDYLKDALQSAWTNGGKPTKILAHAFNKRKISGFTGGATRTDESEDKKLTAAIHYYESDFGLVNIIPSRHVRTRTVLVVDPSLWALCYLRRFKTEKLAKTGDNDSWQLIVEYTLQGNNEAGSSVLADLTTS